MKKLTDVLQSEVAFLVFTAPPAALKSTKQLKAREKKKRFLDIFGFARPLWKATTSTQNFTFWDIVEFSVLESKSVIFKYFHNWLDLESKVAFLIFYCFTHCSQIAQTVQNPRKKTHAFWTFLASLYNRMYKMFQFSFPTFFVSRKSATGCFWNKSDVHWTVPEQFQKFYHARENEEILSYFVSSVTRPSSMAFVSRVFGRSLSLPKECRKLALSVEEVKIIR